MAAPAYLRIRLNGQVVEVLRTDYVRAKTLDFQSSWPNTTEADVEVALQQVLAGNTKRMLESFISADEPAECA